MTAEVLYMRQQHCCCHLITAINAWSFLRDERCPLVDEEFDAFAELVHCKSGSAIGVYKAWWHLGLKVELGPADIRWVAHRLMEGRPVGIQSWSDHYGGHSALVTDVDMSLRCVELVNWDKEELVSKVKWEDLRFPPCWENKCEAFSL